MGKLSDLFVEIASDKRKLDTGLNAAKAQITDFSGKANSMLGTLGVGLSVAGVGKFLADAAQKGSDLGETMSKTKEVFKESFGIVNVMAEDMATKFGAVKGVTLDAAANLGLVAQGAGMTSKQAAELSVRLTRLADDASSFYNVDLGVALEKIRSGLVGEAEPLRAFGVLLSEDAVKAKAMAMGMKTVGGELTETQKVMARTEIIIKGLDKATGDHERTLGSYANQIRRLKGELANWEADFGAPIAGGLSMWMQSIRERGLLATIGRTDWQKEADKAAGVNANQPKQGGPFDAFAQNLATRFKAAEDFKFGSKPFEDRTGAAGLMANLGAFGVFGGQGGIAGNLNRAAMRADLNKQIAAKEKDMRAWGGGHVMDTENFMRSAQEKILQKEDPVAKEQLAELKKAREALDKLVGRQENKAKVGGVVLRGRES